MEWHQGEKVQNSQVNKRPTGEGGGCRNKCRECDMDVQPLRFKRDQGTTTAKSVCPEVSQGEIQVLSEGN